jgi:hypothetical protein
MSATRKMENPAGAINLTDARAPIEIATFHQRGAAILAEVPACSPGVYQTPFSNTNPRRVVLQGFVFSTSCLGGRRWYRTTDPLLVRQVLSP